MPPVSVAKKVGVCPETGRLAESFRVMVTVEVATSFAMTGPVPEIVEFKALTPFEMKMTEPPILENGDEMDKVFDSAVEDLRVQDETPEMSEIEQVP